MIQGLSGRFLTIIWCLIAVVWALPAAAQSEGSPQALLAKAGASLQQAEQLVADDPEAALAAAKEARLRFGELQKRLASQLTDKHLTADQSEKEQLNLKLAEDLFKKGELFQKAAQEKLARSKELRSQGEEAAAQNLEGVAQIEGRLALQNYVRSEIFGLKNQQMVFESLLKTAQ